MYLNKRISDTEATCNKNYRADINFTTNYTRWFLSLLGVWPMVSTNSTKIQCRLSKLVIMIIFALMAFITMPCLLHIILREKDPVNRLSLSGPISFCIASFLKYVSIIYRRRAIKDCIAHLEIDWKYIVNDNERSIMLRNVQIGRDLTFLCAGFMYSCTLGFHLIMPLWGGEMVNELNETIRVLLYPGYDMFVDEQTSPMYEFITYTCRIAACINSTVAVTSCNLAAIMVTHACGQFEIVVSKLKSIHDCRHCVFQARIKDIVSSHVRVLEFSSKIEELLREICCIEVVASTLIICVDEYYFMTEWENSEFMSILTYLVVFISLSFNIFIFCHIGELLKKQCDAIVTAAYMSDWYDLPERTGLSMIMIIGTGNYPRKIKAGRMIELSMTSFSSIMKNTIAYLNMVRTIEN